MQFRALWIFSELQVSSGTRVPCVLHTAVRPVTQTYIRVILQYARVQPSPRTVLFTANNHSTHTTKFVYSVMITVPRMRSARTTTYLSTVTTPIPTRARATRIRARYLITPLTWDSVDPPLRLAISPFLSPTLVPLCTSRFQLTDKELSEDNLGFNG